MGCKSLRMIIAGMVLLMLSRRGMAAKECATTDAKLDVIFVVDGSGSVGSANFDLSKDWVVNVTRSFNFENGLTRVGVIQYSDRTKVTNEINLEDGQTFEILQKNISAIKYQRGGTYTAAALQEVAIDFTAYARPDAKKVMILVTDGRAADGIALKERSQALRDANVTTIAVGVGNNINMEELKIVANGNTGDERVYNATSFALMDSLVVELGKEITCVEIECSEREKDVIFVLDGSGSIGEQDFETAKKWVLNVTKTLDIETDLIHVGVIQYSYWVTMMDMDHQPFTTTEIELGFTHFFDEFKFLVDRIQVFGQSTYTAHALAKTAYDFRRDARPGAKKIMILLTDGKATDSEILVENAQKIRDEDVLTFAVGIGNTDKEELRVIATGDKTSDERVYELSDYNELQSLTEKFGSVIRCDDQN